MATGHFIKALLLSGACIATLAQASYAQAGYESPERIAATAKAYIAARNPWKDMNTEVTADRLDPRSKLAKCDAALEAFLPPGGRIKRRTTVGVRCTSGQAWKIYVPVSIAAYTKVMVARYPIAPGSLIRAEDVSWSKRDIATLGYGYLRSLEGRGGYRARYSIAQGAVLTPNMVEADSAIQKGQKVYLNSNTGGIKVTMAGIAMENAPLGGRIKVKNLSSGKQLEGVVESDHQVLIP
ncbi:flagellar basal body P-ring formation protein FlgA [Spongiibacter taiwanensis]|uniref:flagellar basal body P-ring formation chaperone FlgA n=1 Tax=Spongiibacter taiwanensis TaxID=1748242 RepID=UPI00203566A5|nr:flagellar basal body P-ring formation chaperone FlgA [Spongiibacter taiwanensis]USA43786.1 flagellar basal body P-ring formation protein FlgA [Spongiibacter taiwanensis]